MEKAFEFARIIIPVIIGLGMPIGLSLGFRGMVSWYLRALPIVIFYGSIPGFANFVMGSFDAIYVSITMTIFWAVYLTWDMAEKIQRGQQPRRHPRPVFDDPDGDVQLQNEMQGMLDNLQLHVEIYQRAMRNARNAQALGSSQQRTMQNGDEAQVHAHERTMQLLGLQHGGEAEVQNELYQRAMQDARDARVSLQRQYEIWSDARNRIARIAQDAHTAADQDAVARYCLVRNPDNSLWIAQRLHCSCNN